MLLVWRWVRSRRRRVRVWSRVRGWRCWWRGRRWCRWWLGDRTNHSAVAISRARLLALTRMWWAPEERRALRIHIAAVDKLLGALDSADKPHSRHATGAERFAVDVEQAVRAAGTIGNHREAWAGFRRQPLALISGARRRRRMRAWWPWWWMRSRWVRRRVWWRGRHGAAQRDGRGVSSTAHEEVGTGCDLERLADRVRSSW